MIDVMRQQPEKKKPKSPRKDKNKNGDKDKNSDESASSFAQKRKQHEEDEIACYCCGDKDCLLPCCPKKDTLPAHLWHNPKYANKEKSSHTQTVQRESVEFICAKVHHTITIKVDESK